MAEWGFETKAIHSGLIPSQHQGATAVPIYETTSYAYDSAQDLADVFDGRKFGHTYSRISNPTVTAFEQRITALERGTGAVATASGMAAISTTIFTLVAQGDEIISSKSLFAGTFLLFDRLLKKYGVRIRYVDPGDIDGIRSAISQRTQLIFVETIGNPKIDVPDIEKISRVAVENNIPFVVDSTLTTPYLVQLKKLGAAIAVHSTTKYITGNGSTIGGVMVDLGNFDWSACKNRDLSSLAEERGSDFALLFSARRHIVQNMGNCPSPFNAYLQCLGLETLSVRMERHCSNAMDLANFLSDHQKVSGVNYPGLKTSPHHEIAHSQFNGRYGGLLTFKLGSKRKCFQLIDHLELVHNLANLGDAKTLIIHPASTIYHECSEEERARAGVSEDMVRVSVGIETVADIIQDFDQALKEVSK
jgi:O-acetylhomoserine (thiol)-lyase